MLTLALTALLSQTPIEVAVIDISVPDAIYEDVSRALADQVVDTMNAAGMSAQRVDEREIPEGCRIGPCLGVVAKEHHAHVVVLMDSTEVDKKKNGVALAALWARDGRPLAVKRYTVAVSGGKAPKELSAFVSDLSKQVGKLLPAADAGVKKAPEPATGR